MVESVKCFEEGRYGQGAGENRGISLIVNSIPFEVSFQVHKDIQ